MSQIEQMKPTPTTSLYMLRADWEGLREALALTQEIQRYGNATHMSPWGQSTSSFPDVTQLLILGTLYFTFILAAKWQGCCRKIKIKKL